MKLIRAIIIIAIFIAIFRYFGLEFLLDMITQLIPQEGN